MRNVLPASAWLNLSDSKIGPKDLLVLSLVLARNTALTALDLSLNDLVGTNPLLPVRAPIERYAVAWLWMSGSAQDVSGIKALSYALESNNAIEMIDLQVWCGMREQLRTGSLQS